MSDRLSARVCPACHVGALWIRNSWSSHQLLTVETLQCQNERCGAVYRAHREITHEFVPSAVPNPAYQLPPAGERERAELPLNPRRRPNRTCPACGVGALYLQDGVPGDPLRSVEVLRCVNTLCGATYRSYREIEREIIPPRTRGAVAQQEAHALGELQQDFFKTEVNTENDHV